MTVVHVRWDCSRVSSSPLYSWFIWDMLFTVGEATPPGLKVKATEFKDLLNGILNVSLKQLIHI